jgi:phage baseplate assembly protein W
MSSDIALASGDIVLGGHGDFKQVMAEEDLLQGIAFRLQTVAGDYLLVPDCGSSLELFVGQPNTQETGAAIEESVKRALTHDGYISGSNLTVRCVYVNTNQVAVLISVEQSDAVYVKAGFSLDLCEGKVTPR